MTKLNCGLTESFAFRRSQREVADLDQVMASWSVFKELILSGAGSISETQMALDNLVLDLELALELCLGLKHFPEILLIRRVDQCW